MTSQNQKKSSRFTRLEMLSSKTIIPASRPKFLTSMALRNTLAVINVPSQQYKKR